MTEIKIDNNNEILINAVKKLQLRFPVAEIQRATKESKGNISSFLNDKKPVSDVFLQTFSDAFNIDLREFGFTKGLTRLPEKVTNQHYDDWSSLKAFNEHLLKEVEFLKELLLKK